MKKIYNTPSIKTVVLNTPAILAGSIEPQSIEDDNGGHGSAEARGMSIFDAGN